VKGKYNKKKVEIEIVSEGGYGETAGREKTETVSHTLLKGGRGTMGA
jgi:hypothetical protein